MRHVLVTGGCGFIGKVLSLRLARHGYRVRVLDSLSEQVHGRNPDTRWTKENGIGFVRGSVSDQRDCRAALEGINVVAHLAAETGSGQSMYELTRFMETNVLGTATLLEESRRQGVTRFVLASSRAVYGEGPWECSGCGRVYPSTRTIERAAKTRSWNPTCPRCGKATTRLLPVREDDPVAPTSIYGMSKLAQEQLLSMSALALGLGHGILRLFNVFGPGQSLKNPYTGVLTVFINRSRLNKPLDLYEDGEILRDFVFVDDVARAIHVALESRESGVFNIGSASTRSIRRLAELIIESADSSSRTEVTRKMRAGDVRGLVADNERARQTLGWQPEMDADAGIRKFVQWALQSEFEDRYEESLEELKSHGLYG